MEFMEFDPGSLGALTQVARDAILARFEGRTAEPRGAVAGRAPVFVTIKIEGVLRGCMGELEARHPDLVAETADRALAAAFHDPRFPPLTQEELGRSTIDVTLLGRLEPVDSVDELDPARFGIEVSDDAGRRAVLLPGIEGIDTVDQQLSITRSKAGIGEDAKLTIRRFRVVKVSE